MASSLESKAFFEARCKTVGLAEDLIQKLVDSGVTNLASMVFFSVYQPGGQDDTPLPEAASKALALDPLPGPVVIAIRRLHYEAHAMYVADLKLKVTATEDDLPKRMPNAERSARHFEQKTRLRGICLEGEFECSHSLLDAVVQQYDRDELKYIDLSSCTTRDQEMTGLKRDAQLSLDADGQIKLKPSVSLAVADTSTELRLKNAMTRRAIAYDQAGLVNFEVLNKWTERLFAAQMRLPPPGYRAVSINQMLEADRALWRRLADTCRTGIVPVPGVPRPLDDSINSLMDSSDVTYYLLPLPSSSTSRLDYGPDKSGDRNIRSSPKGGKDRKGKGKGDSKGAGKGKSRVVPEALGWPNGSQMKSKDGSRFCYAFNSSKGCRHGKVGSKCNSGIHLCYKYGCEGRHSASQCTGIGN